MSKTKHKWIIEPGKPLTEMDKEILYWQNRNKSVPSRDLIKSPEQIHLAGTEMNLKTKAFMRLVFLSPKALVSSLLMMVL